MQILSALFHCCPRLLGAVRLVAMSASLLGRTHAPLLPEASVSAPSLAQRGCAEGVEQCSAAHNHRRGDENGVRQVALARSVGCIPAPLLLTLRCDGLSSNWLFALPVAIC